MGCSGDLAGRDEQGEDAAELGHAELGVDGLPPVVAQGGGRLVEGDAGEDGARAQLEVAVGAGPERLPQVAGLLGGAHAGGGHLGVEAAELARGRSPRTARACPRGSGGRGHRGSRRRPRRWRRPTRRRSPARRRGASPRRSGPVGSRLPPQRSVAAPHPFPQRCVVYVYAYMQRERSVHSRATRTATS